MIYSYKNKGMIISVGGEDITHNKIVGAQHAEPLPEILKTHIWNWKNIEKFR